MANTPAYQQNQKVLLNRLLIFSNEMKIKFYNFWKKIGQPEIIFPQLKTT
jgi:hypothetical protein